MSLIMTDDAHDIVFKPNTTEAMRIASGGVVTVQNTPSNTDNSLKVANTSFVRSVVSNTANTNIGRNYLHTGAFQSPSGFGNWTTSGVYTADRWLNTFRGGSTGMSLVTTTTPQYRERHDRIWPRNIHWIHSKLLCFRCRQN